MRNPIDRTLSHYLHSVRQGRETRSFSKLISVNSYVVMTSRYGWQLDHYLAHFDPDQLMLVTTEELDRNPQGTIRKLLKFIGVDDSFTVDTSMRYNVTAAKFAQSGAHVPNGPGIVVDFDQISLSPETRAALAEVFRADVAKLRSTWPQFSGWEEEL